MILNAITAAALIGKTKPTTSHLCILKGHSVSPGIMSADADFMAVNLVAESHHSVVSICPLHFSPANSVKSQYQVLAAVRQQDFPAKKKQVTFY